MPEVPGEGPLDVRVHGQAQVRAQGLAAQGNVQATQAGGGEEKA